MPQIEQLDFAVLLAHQILKPIILTFYTTDRFIHLYFVHFLPLFIIEYLQNPLFSSCHQNIQIAIEL